MAINIKKSHEGRFHRLLGIPESEPIPMRLISKKLKSKDKSVRAMANFARNERGWNK